MKNEQKWRWDFRVWHWLNAMVVLGILGTVFLRETFLSAKANSEILLAKLSTMDVTLTAQQAKLLGKAIRHPMWEWHILLGYALSALLVWRIALFFTQSGKHNYQNFKSASLHKKAVKIGYIVVYLLLALMALSGLSMVFSETLGLVEATVEQLEEFHDVIYHGVLIFVPLHILGVIVAENRDEKGILSDMIHGGSKE